MMLYANTDVHVLPYTYISKQSKYLWDMTVVFTDQGAQP